jgi:hypothetical protein
MTIILERPTSEPVTIIEDIVVDTDISEKRYRGLLASVTGTVSVILENGTNVNIEVLKGLVYPISRIKQVNSGSVGVIQGIK